MDTDADESTDELGPIARRLEELGGDAEIALASVLGPDERHRLALWLFLYHESSDVLVHAELFHPIKPQIFKHPIVKTAQILGGSGTIGYVLRNRRAEAVADTFDDPRGTVAVQDTLIDNYSWCGVPIQDASIEDPRAPTRVLGIVSFFPVSRVTKEARWLPESTDQIQVTLTKFVDNKRSAFVLLCHLASLDEANRTLTDVAPSDVQAPLHVEIGAMLRRVLALGTPFARLPRACYLEEAPATLEGSTFHCANSSSIRFDVRRERVDSLRRLQWRALTESEESLETLVSLDGEPTTPISLLQPFNRGPAPLFVAIHSRSIIGGPQPDLISSLFTQWQDLFATIYHACRELQPSGSQEAVNLGNLKKRKVLSEAAAALFGEISLLILDEHRPASVAGRSMTVLLDFIQTRHISAFALSPPVPGFIHEISQRSADLIALRHNIIALSLWHRVYDWLITAHPGFAGKALDLLTNSGNWRVLQRAVTINSVSSVKQYPPVDSQDILLPERPITGLSARTIIWPHREVTFSWRDAYFPLDLHVCPAGLAESKFEHNQPLTFTLSEGRLSLSGTKTLDGQYSVLAHLGQRILAGGPIESVDAPPHPHTATLKEDAEKTLTAFARKELNTALLRDYAAKVTEASRRAGVAAIMARNLSHNLGSHVLARHAVRTVKRLCLADEAQDGQFLDRYVQSRMDFVAQVATDWPRWTEPARLVGELLWCFLAQRIVLQEIVASEGFGALEWREQVRGKERTWIGRGTAGAGEAVKAGEIRLACIGVCRDSWDRDRETSLATRVVQEEPLLYAEPLGTNDDGYICRVDLKNDPFVAIPGGLTGWHAFFVILENVIRNAAKHGKWNPSELEPAKRPLDVIIEFLQEDDLTPPVVQIDKEGNVTRPAYPVRIYDNVSVLAEKTLGEINDSLDAPIIEVTGELSRKHWGLAEMKIAALFLQGRALDRLERFGDTITGTQGKDGSAVPSTLADPLQGRTVIRAVRSPLGTLGYELYLLRPARLGLCADQLTRDTYK